jgi:hypothetical protein
VTNCSIRGSEDGAHLHSLAEIIAMEPVSRAGSCGNEPSGDRPGGSFLVGMPMFQKIRFAANKPQSTEPGVSAVTVMLSTRTGLSTARSESVWQAEPPASL